MSWSSYGIERETSIRSAKQATLMCMKINQITINVYKSPKLIK